MTADRQQAQHSDRVPAAWWSVEAAALCAAAGSSPSGLTQAQAGQRLARGPGRARGKGRAQGVAALLLRQYESPLVLILVLAATVSVIVGEWTEAVIILAIVGGSTFLGFAQEYKAARAVAQLQERLALTVTALRDGREATVPAETVVAGDVVLLSAGNLVPADGVILEARDFLVTQAALTGESFPVEKRAGVSSSDAPLAERDNAVFLGTSVRSGTARMLVAVTGGGTAFGKIEERIGESDPETDFERGIRRFGSLLMRVMMVIVTAVLSVNLLLGRPVIDSLLFSVALAVGLTPELLPAIVSVTMAAGARRMARGGVLVRRSSAIENLGTVDILCTDKTGTLTGGQMALQAATDPDGQESDAVFRHALINAHFETGIDNPLDAAIVAAAGARAVAVPLGGKVDEIPYDFQRKRLTVVVDQPDSADHLVVTKGAFDTVLACCDRIAGAGAEVALDEAARERLAAFVARKGAEGIRVLALATRSLPPKTRYDVSDEDGMVFAGFLLFADPLKAGIRETLVALGQLGIAVKIITGDNRFVAEHVARAVGLVPKMIAGADLVHAGDEALWHLAEDCNVFAEADPQQKERIVRALQKRGHSVAYMGDGINDAPALQHADVGISVQEAVDVARESADIVLLQRDLDVLRQGIVDGRQTFANTLKYISITTSANFGNMISMAAGTLFLPFLPLTAAQILLNNFLSDIPSLTLAGDRVDPEAVAVAPRWDIHAIRNYMVIFGMVSTLFDLLTFGLLLRVFHADAGMFQTAWFTISLLTELVVVFVLRTRRSLWKSRPGRWLVLASLGMVAVALLLPLVGPVARSVGLTPLPLPVLASGIGIVVCYALVTEAVKRRLFRSSARRVA